jgi:hypothetical protein
MLGARRFKATWCLLDLKNIDWKVWAKIVGILLLFSIFGNSFKYYEYRYTLPASFIPEEVMIQISRPYLVAIITSTLSALVAWGFYFYGKPKITIVVGLLGFAFEYINFTFIGESWNF